jgi:RNA polymerase sigma-70 factor (ECF subfamily)
VERDEVFQHLRERIRAYAASRIGSPSADDLAQETLLVLHEKYAAVTQPEEVLALAFQIVRFKLAAHMRKSVRRGETTAVSVDGLMLADPGISPEVAAERQELKERLVAALSRMGERCRELFRLKLEGKDFEAIRLYFGAASINTVYTWDLRCRQQLKAELGVLAERKV